MLMPPRLTSSLVEFDSIDLETLNRCLAAWGHRMGPLERPMGAGPFHGLAHNGELLGVAATSSLIKEPVAGLKRSQAVELARICCARPHLCRVVLRLWREFVFPSLGHEWAVSYQDAIQHTGNLYRFDGWVQLGRSRSGTDQRSGKKGRNKRIWGWSGNAEQLQRARTAA